VRIHVIKGSQHIVFTKKEEIQFFPRLCAADFYFQCHTWEVEKEEIS
jgi:hypothetical protein